MLRLRDASESWTPGASLTELAQQADYFSRKLAPSLASHPAACSVPFASSYQGGCGG